MEQTCHGALRAAAQGGAIASVAPPILWYDHRLASRGNIRIVLNRIQRPIRFALSAHEGNSCLI